MNGSRPGRVAAPKPNPAPRIVVDELEAASQRAARKRKIFSVIVLAPLVAGLLATSVYSFLPQVPSSQDPDREETTREPAPASDPRAAAARIAALEQAVARNPKDHAAAVALGNAYYDQHRFADAEKAYRRALDLGAPGPDVRVDYGTCLFYQNRAKEAVAQYEAALKVDPKHINARINLGMAFQALGQPEKAAAVWSEALSLAADPVTRQRIQERISRAARGS